MTALLRPAVVRDRVSRTERLAAAARRRPRVALLLGFCALSFLLFSSTWVSPFDHVIGAPGGDQVGFFWALEWPLWAITHGHNPLFSSYLNAPDGFSVMWTYPPLPALLMAPVTVVAGPVFSYNLLVTVGLASSAWFATLATHRFVPRWWPAAAAGTLFGFGPYELGHALSHAVLVAQFAAPLLLLLGHECLVRQRWRPSRAGAALGLVMAVQVFVFVETAALVVLVAALALATAWVLRDSTWRRRMPHALRCLEVACGVFALVCAYPLVYMLIGPQHMTAGTLRPVGALASNLANFIVAAPTQLIAPNHTLVIVPQPAVDANPAEWSAYLGLPLLIIMATVVVRRWRSSRLVRFLGFMLVVTVVLSLGPLLWLSADAPATFTMPAAVFASMPLIQNLLWCRVAIVVALLAGVVLAVYLHEQGGTHPLLPRLAHRVLMVALVVSLLPLFPYPTLTAPTVPAFFTGAQVQRIPAGSTALVAPFTRDGDGVDPEYWQVASGFQFRMTGGYVFVPGPAGPSYVLHTPLNTAMEAIAHGSRGADLAVGDRAGMLTELTRDHIGTVIVGPMPNRAVMVQFMSALLGRPPEDDQGVQVWWNVG